MMQRGYNNTFYYVESDVTGSSDMVMELRVVEVNQKFEWKKRVAFEQSSGAVMALEMDPDNDTKLDSGTMSDGTIGQRFVPNELFFIDDSLQLYQVKQDLRDRYDVIENQNLSEIDGIQLALRDLKNKSFPRISVTEKCLTIGSKSIAQ